MKTVLAILAAAVVAVWGWDVINTVVPPGTHPLWLARQEALYLSGLLSIAMMSLAMLLATRPAWLESPLGGMDRIYRTHKWAGILAVSFAATHWLVELSSDVLKDTIGREGRLPKEKFTGFLEILRDLSKDMGEWAIYAVLAMLLITLWKKFPYHVWRFLHRIMPVLYLMLVLHATLLAPRDYWTQAAGALLALLLCVGSYAALRSLFGRIGHGRTYSGEIVAVERPADDVTSVRSRLPKSWPGHRPGQFAFVTFDGGESAHPFTIASADRGDGVIDFQIKALGDFTRTLASRLKVGQNIRVEGPYGRFDLARNDLRRRQIWIAGGIGVTPFLAWLESLQTTSDKAPVADLHYCTRDHATDAFAARLKSLCANLPGIRLQIHSAQQGKILKAEHLGDAQNAEIWFCGPKGLAETLHQGLRTLGKAPRFHQELFEMR